MGPVGTGGLVRRQARRVALDIAKVRASGNRVTRADLDRWLVGLSIPVRKVRTKDAARSARRTTVASLDALCRSVVMARDHGICRWPGCGKESSAQWCHCYSRRYKWLRWDLDNSFVLCAGHHLGWHHRPLEGAKWWGEELGPIRYKNLVIRAARPSKVNTDAVRIYLEQAIKEYA